MANGMAVTINMAETMAVAPDAGSAKWAQVRGYLSRVEKVKLDDHGIGPERAWRMCRSYRKSQVEVLSR